MGRGKIDRLPIAEAIIRKICEANVYSYDSGLARRMTDELWKLPVNVIQSLHTLVVAGGNWEPEPPAPKRYIKHAEALLADIGRQVRVMVEDRHLHGDSKLSRVGVKLFVAGMLVLETDLGRAVEWLASDVYFDENSRWDEADTVEVYVL